MKSRILLILLAVMLALSVGLTGCGGEQAAEITEYTLTVSSAEGGSVTTPGEGTFAYDQITVVDLAAEAEDGYRFVNWTGDVTTVGNVNATTTIITTDNDYAITANFAYGPVIPLRNPGSFVQMTIAHPDSLDPAWGYDTFSCEQVQYIYGTLLFFDGEEVDQFMPALATEWELLDDNVTYRFKIREGVKFHNGSDLTSEDVEYSFERAMVQDRRGGPIWMFYSLLLGFGRQDWGGSRGEDGDIRVTFEEIDNAVEVDGDWVLFHLSDPAWGLAFLQILCSPWASIVDKEWCIANGEWDGTEETWQGYNNPDKTDSYLYNHTNGTGPWKLEEWNPGIQIELVRNDDYWREPAAFETVSTQVVEEWTARKTALLAGDADLIYVHPTDMGELDGITDLNVYQNLPELRIDAFLLNFDIPRESEFIGSGALDGDGIPTDFFTDMDVRKGFCYAFDYEIFIEDGWLGEAEQRGSPIIEGIPFYNPNASMYSLDLDKAEEHLKSAWGGEAWEKGFKFTVLYNPGNLPREIACKILAENLAGINPKFQMTTQPADWGTVMVPNIVGGLLPMFQIGWLPDYPHPDNFVVPFMASYGWLAEHQGYGYPELDELIEDSFKELDPTVQEDMYYELQERYYEDAPSIMLCQPLSRRYFTNYMQGYYYNPFASSIGTPLYYMSKSES